MSAENKCPEARVFIAGFRYEIVYLPATCQVVSRLERLPVEPVIGGGFSPEEHTAPESPAGE